MSNSPGKQEPGQGKTLATIIEPDGSESQREIEWSIDSLRGLLGGGFKIVASYKGCHVLEADDWHARGIPQNMTASVKCGRMLHGRIVIAKEPR